MIGDDEAWSEKSELPNSPASADPVQSALDEKQESLDSPEVNDPYLEPAASSSATQQNLDELRCLALEMQRREAVAQMAAAQGLSKRKMAEALGLGKRPRGGRQLWQKLLRLALCFRICLFLSFVSLVWRHSAYMTVLLWRHSAFMVVLYSPAAFRLSLSLYIYMIVLCLAACSLACSETLTKAHLLLPQHFQTAQRGYSL